MKTASVLDVFLCGFIATLGVLAAFGVVEVICDIDFSCFFSWRP